MTAARRLWTEAVLCGKKLDVAATLHLPVSSPHQLTTFPRRRRRCKSLGDAEEQLDFATQEREASKSPNDERTDAVNIGVERHRRTCDQRMNRGSFFYCSFFPSWSPWIQHCFKAVECGKSRASGMWAGPQRHHGAVNDIHEA